MKNSRLGVFLGVVSVFLSGCSNEVEYLNAAPQISAVGPGVLLEEGRFLLFVSIRDLEHDPVDLSGIWRSEMGEEEPVEWVPGEGHGRVGLSSSYQDGGSLHEVVIHPPANTALKWQLLLTGNDRIGGESRPIESPLFSVSEGLQDTRFATDLGF